jgi:hypothetical protein
MRVQEPEAAGRRGQRGRHSERKAADHHEEPPSRGVADDGSSALPTNPGIARTSPISG